ncbi:TPA: histidine ammonia-lyase [Candidatus Woesearchaeota archaeon]|nr:histidine ammonia-lyase [Candidatus Woesearchaeota archaeon]
MKMIEIDGATLNIEKVKKVARDKEKVFFSEKTMEKVQKNWNALQEMLDRGDILYGVNTGIGAFGNIILSKDQGSELSKRMIRAHAAGWGNPLPEDEARACLLLRANVLARGYSGVRPKTLQMFAELLNKNIVPVIYEKGSVGTSGDLAPLAQMALVFMGEGEAFIDSKRMDAEKALKIKGLEKIELEAREGLALFNGAQTMTAIGTLAVYDAEKLLKNAQIAAALIIDSLNAVTLAFDSRLHALRPFEGQNIVAKNIRNLIDKSTVLMQKKKDTQSAYSLRCVPQVLGASRDAIGYSRKQVEIEMNSVADNPIFLTEEKTYLAGGNFHGQPVAYAMDLLGIAVSEIGNMAERRVNRLLNPALNAGLPAFLIAEGEGLNSGLMITQYTAAALVSENKILASPASVDSIPCSADQEDHVSMGTIAARKAREIIRNTEAIVGIEFMCAAQAYEFQKPARLGAGTSIAYSVIRQSIQKVKEDRIFYKDLDIMALLMRNGKIIEEVEKTIKVI